MLFKTFNCRRCAVILGMVLMIPFLLYADDDSGIGSKFLSIGPRATYSMPIDADSGQWYGGAQVRLHVTPALGLEGSVDYRSNTFGNVITLKTYPVQATLLAYLMPGANWSPFLLGGCGWYYTEVDGPHGFSSTDNRTGLHAGAGVEFMLNESLSLDATYRYIWLENLSSKDLNVLDKTYSDSGAMITVGLNFLF
ncbi:MAG: porin family protein [Endomicrobiales bacterium]